MKKNTYKAFVEFADTVLPNYDFKISKFSPGTGRPITLEGGARKTLLASYKEVKLAYDKFYKNPKNRTEGILLLLPVFAAQDIFESHFTRYCSRRFVTGEPEEGAIVVPEEYAHLDLCVDPESGKGGVGRDLNYFLFDRERNLISSLNATFYITVCKITNPLKYAKFVLPVYDPTRPFGYFMYKAPDGNELEAVNSYMPPLWLSYKGEVPDCLPKEIETLFNQVKGEMDRKFFFHFLRQMIIGRNSVYLVLQAEGGTGKSVMKEVFQALVGKHNYADGKKSTITTQFNSQLEGTRLVVFDEIKYSQSEEAVMKEIPNNSISIEGKFKNATKHTKIFCSLILMNNFKKDNYIAMDGRKFSPIRLSAKRLDKILPKKQINTIVKKCAGISEPTYDEAYVAQIGRWIIKHGDNSDLFPQGEYRGPKYWDLAHSSMSQWQRIVINSLLDPGEPASGDFRRLFGNGHHSFKEFKNAITKKGARKDSSIKFPNDISAFREFLDIYRNLRGEEVFELGRFNEEEQDFTLHILQKEKKEEIDL